MSDVIFNITSSEGEAVTFTELQGVSLPKYRHLFSPGDQYSASVEKSINEAMESIKAALSESTRLLDTNVRLNKGSKAQIIAAIQSLSRYSNRDLNFDLELIREHIDKDMHHIRTEVISSLTGYINNLAEPLMLKHNKEQTKSTFKDLFDIYNVFSDKDDLLRLLRKYLEQVPDKEERKVIKSILSHFENTFKKERYSRSQYSQGMVKLKKYQGQQEFFFGDVRSVQSYFNLSFSFAYDSLNEYGELEQFSTNELLSLNMTNFQIMELLQGSLNGHWVKATMSHYLGTPVPLPNIKKTEHDSLSQHNIEHTEETKKLSSEIKKLLTTINSTSQSTKIRKEIHELVISISELLNKEIDARRNNFDQCKERLLADSMTLNFSELDSLLEAVEDKHPKIAEKIKMLTLPS